MCWLIAGLVIFFGIHLLPSCTGLRARLLARLGELPYKGAFSAVALAGFALIVYGMAHAPHIPLWRPPAIAAAVAAVVMAPALILLAAANFDNNIKRLARHPMSLGVLLWALSHLLANGDWASLLLFGAFAAFALHNLRGRAQPLTPSPLKKDALAVVIGLLAYFLLVALHGPLFGVALFL